MSDISVGVLDLASSLRELQQDYGLDTVSGTNLLPDGHRVTIRWTGNLLLLEADGGHVVVLDGTEVDRALEEDGA